MHKPRYAYEDDC